MLMIVQRSVGKKLKTIRSDHSSLQKNISCILDLKDNDLTLHLRTNYLITVHRYDLNVQQ